VGATSRVANDMPVETSDNKVFAQLRGIRWWRSGANQSGGLRLTIAIASGARKSQPPLSWPG